MRLIIFLLFYLFLGIISSKVYHFYGLTDILLWPVVVPLKILFETHDDRGEQ